MIRWVLILWAFSTGAALAQSVVEVRDGAHVARFEAPTHRYGHAIMGDQPEWGRLCLETDGQGPCVTLPDTHVFEDMAPRLHDVDGDGQPEAVVVESTTTQGAALVIYKREGDRLDRIATPHIGTRNRWLAVIGVADLDGDGAIELAYVDRPHLAKTIRIWRFERGGLTAVADLPGYTNHRIGEFDIAGGIRTCTGTPEMIVATANWQRLAAIRFDGRRFLVQDIGPHRGRTSFATAMTCG